MICIRCNSAHDRVGQRWCRFCHAAYMREWRKTHPLSPEQRLKDWARAIANVYQKRGKLIPEPCHRCGSSLVEKHHDDYTQPLDVVWLCRKCHLHYHRLAIDEERSRVSVVKETPIVVSSSIGDSGV